MLRASWLETNLIFILGKGGVGKSSIAQTVARDLAARGKRTLLARLPSLADDARQSLENPASHLWSVTLNPGDCFREYAMMKLRLKPLYSAFLGNRVTQYLQKAAPGVRELVLLGKIWFERENYGHVVVDMPSTGYALTMLHTPFNFAELFPGGPIFHDAREMIATLSDPARTSLVAVSLAEEMPIQETLELAMDLKKLMPENPCRLVLNRLIRLPKPARDLHQRRWAGLGDGERASPLWSGLDYLVARENKQRALLEGMAAEWSAYGGSWLEVDEGAVRA